MAGGKNDKSFDGIRICITNINITLYIYTMTLFRATGHHVLRPQENGRSYILLPDTYIS